MSDLQPRAFDIETSGLDSEAVITVAGIASEMGSWLALNTAGRQADAAHLETQLEARSGSNVQVVVCEDEQALLEALSAFATERLDGDRHYLAAYNGEVWKGGFDLPFLRRVCARKQVDWPFPPLAYADVMTMMDRFHTNGATDLVSVYDDLIGDEDCDPFTDSERAVAAFDEGNWTDLLLHNLADIHRTRELAVLAGRYIPKSDFKMKNLTPPAAATSPASISGPR